MAKNKKINDCVYFLENETKDFIIIRSLRDIYNISKEIENKGKEDKNNKNKVLIFDFWNISEYFDKGYQNIFGTLINKYKKNPVFSVVLKHCAIKAWGNDNSTPNNNPNLEALANEMQQSDDKDIREDTGPLPELKATEVKRSFNFFENNRKLKLDSLYITDELYSMSPNLGILFKNINAEKLFLKKIKINSKKQLNNFFDFIQGVECQELILNDVFIELLIKENENDDNELKTYFTLEKGKIIIMKEETKLETKIKKLTLIDCPLFALPDENDLFKNINQYQDISIDIDENSLLNPIMITKFKINEGLIDVCYDLDSYKLSQEDEEEKEEKEDYLEYINYIFKIIIDNENYRKIKFKNFDTNKLEYITGDSYNYKKIDENQWVLNNEEKEKKKKFEKFYRDLKGLIKDKKLEKIKELIFDNCATFFIELILDMVKSDLDLLKLKKCAKDTFNINRTKLLKITHLYLFDTPITFGQIDTEEDKIESGKLTLKIVSLEHLCEENHLNSYVAIERLKTLISYTKRKIICFEMNALPLLMTYLISEQKNENKSNIKEIPKYFKNDNNDESKKSLRTNWIDNSYKFNFKDKTIILRKNNIRNQFENFHYLKDIVGDLKKEDKHKNESDYGRDFANLDVDYKSFFNNNNIKDIELENCLFSNFKILELKSEEAIQKIQNNQKASEKLNSTFLNFYDEEKTYKIDMKTIKEIVLKNNFVEDFGFLINSIEFLNNNKNDIIKHLEKAKIITNFFVNLLKFFKTINGKMKIIINDIIEQKELYCLLCLCLEDFEEMFLKIDDEKNEKGKKEKIEKILFPKKWYNNIKQYFVKEINEDGNFVKEKNEEGNKFSYTILDYYYTSEKEKEYFNGLKNYKYDKNFIEIKENENNLGGDINKFKFEIEYKYDDPLEIIYK